MEIMNIIGKRYWFFLISAIIIIPGIISLIVFGFKPGVEFQSGTTFTLRFGNQISQEQLRQELTVGGFGEAVIQRTGEGDYIIRTKEMSTESKQGLIASLEKSLNTTITVRDFFAVSPVIAAETGQNAAIAVIISAVFMLFYIALAFRRIPKSFRWGTCAIISLIHDVLVVMGIFSILGWALGVQIDAMFISGMLTVVGYSINNTIVVFDRIRENVSKGISKDFEATVNISVMETFGRCLNTSVTTLFPVVAIFLLGGATIHYFILTLLLGVAVGTYDSICIAGSLLVVWDKGELKKWFSRPATTNKTA
jgi:preprotein translocase subunit SecF